jgi:hypothetical protein
LLLVQDARAGVEQTARQIINPLHALFQAAHGLARQPGL